MPRDHIVEQLAHAIDVAASGEILERPDTHVTRRHSRQHGARQHVLAINALARGDHGQRAGGGDAAAHASPR